MNIRSGCLMLLTALVVTTCVPRALTPQPVTETPTTTFTPTLPLPTPTPQPIPETPAITPVLTLPLPTPTRKVWNPDEIIVGLIQAGSGDEWHDANTTSISDLARNLDLPLKVYDSQFRPEAQITAFRNYIQDPDVNVIVVNAIEPTGWDELLKQAQSAGKVVIFEDGPIAAPEDLYATHIGSDFVEVGRRAAAEMCKLLEHSEKKNVWELVGNPVGPDTFKTDERDQGFRERMGECGITITNSQRPNGNAFESQETMEDFLRKNADIQGAFAQNERSLLNAIQAIKSVGLKPDVDIKVVLILSAPGILNAHPGTEINVYIEYNPMLALKVYEAARRALNGEMLPKWIPMQEDIFYPKDGKWVWDHSRY
jgi:galactofuranose transport system substrate-binding protein